MPVLLPIIVFVAIIIISNTIKIVPQYERGVVFRLGRLMDPPRGPGLTWLSSRD